MSKASLRIARSLILAPLVLTPAFLACTGQEKGIENTLRPEMRQAYKSVSRLFYYIWDEEEFNKPQEEANILASLDNLINNFHKVESKTPLANFEPGFAIALQTNQQMLKDARTRFASGAKDYANWKLKGISANCISCHSRYNVPVDFVGSPPRVKDDSPASLLPQAEFLFATRQFDKASELLYKIAHDLGSDEAGYHQAFEALKLWLVIQVRVKSRYTKAAGDLNILLQDAILRPSDRRAIKNWIAELVGLENQAKLELNLSKLEQAKKLLEPVTSSPILETEQASLVKTLQASTLLHKELETKLSPEDKRQATYLLAVAYTHLPILGFGTFQELYLEQCIREFPQTAQARKCYDFYNEYLQNESTGSSGTHLEPEQVLKLRELRALAFGFSE